MDKVAVSNPLTNVFDFAETVNQKDCIVWGLNNICFTNGKITAFEYEFFSEFATVDESKHSVTIIDTGDNNFRVERSYTHTALTLFFDVTSGYVFILTKTGVTYFQVTLPAGNKVVKKPRNFMKMTTRNIAAKAYTGLSLTNGFCLLFKDGEIVEMIAPPK
jgi:hypothetical protein